MKTELEIKDILKRPMSVESKVREIRKFMDWDGKKLTEAIEKHGTRKDEERLAIIKEFWGRKK